MSNKRFVLLKDNEYIFEYMLQQDKIIRSLREENKKLKQENEDLIFELRTEQALHRCLEDGKRYDYHRTKIQNSRRE